MTLLKHCTGHNCEKKHTCCLYEAKPENPFNCVSPLDLYDECPFYAQKPAWGVGRDEQWTIEEEEEFNRMGALG